MSSIGTIRSIEIIAMTEQMPPNYANPMDIDESDLPF